MGKASARRRDKASANALAPPAERQEGEDLLDAQESCPVCFEAFEARESGHIPENALACSNSHAICATCVRNLLEPAIRCGSDCTGVKFKCPVCRTYACVNRFHMLVLMKGTWGEAHSMFECSHAIKQWMDN